MLDVVAARVAESEGWVSYNGKSFDLPLLRSRFILNRRRLVEPGPHLDMLHLARRVHRARPWRKTLKEVERRVLGFDRGADIDSASVGAMYAHFLRTGDARQLLKVVQHNESDIATLIAMLGFYGRPMAHLEARDLACAARSVRRAGDLDRARRMAEAAAATRLEPVTLEVRAEMAKACGDRDRALGDFELLAADIDEPRIRLQLAKLYEHHKKDLHRALTVAEQGTGEGAQGERKRRQRLERKIARAADD
jgi:hypothetical protein